ncbi:MAG TPA: sulfurtransferase [Streptosporangiaceae bacterium]|nr:sulfurtransferase [Streptosporangiaceae bacterium]
MSNQSGQPRISQPGPHSGQPPSPLIRADELAALLDSADPPVVLDVRWRLGGPPGIESYLGGHLPTARFVDLDTELSGRPGAGGRHPLPEPAKFEAAMRTAGLNEGKLAVAYDDGDSTVAARLWWMLRYYGHARATVLDGGFRAWAISGLPLTKLVKRPAPGNFAVLKTGGMPVIDDDQAGRLARSGYLLDSRVTGRYTGEVEPVDRVGGHIPGAISAPTKDNVDPDGLFRAPGELARRFAGLGLPAPDRGAGDAAGPGGEPVIAAYCGSGVTAAHQVLALELAGLRGALYVGSWSAWSYDPQRPVAAGPERG